MMLCESACGLISTPLDCHRKLPGREPVGVGVGVGVGAGLPVHATPLRAKSVGAGLLTLFHEPLKPIVAEPPVARLPFELALIAVICVPVCEYVALQPWVTCWPAVKSQVSVQELSGLPRLVIATLALNPPAHCDPTV